MLAAKNVQRQVAVAVVVAVKESAQLMAVDRIVGGVEIEHDLLRRRGMQRQKHLDEEVLDVAMPGDDFLVAALLVGPHGRQFQTVQRALARQRLAAIFASASILAGRIGLAHQHGQKRIVAKGVMVVEVFVAQGQGEYPLGHQFGHGVFDPLGIAVIGEAGGESPQNAGLGFHLPQQESAGVRSDGPAVESGGDRPAAEALGNRTRVRYTL